MRKSIIFLVLVIFVLVCAGCTKKQITKNEGSTPDQNVSSVKQNGQQTRQLSGKGQGSEGQSASTVPAQSGKKTVDLKDIHFDFDKSIIHPEDRPVLAGHADFLLKNKNVKITVEGNCDERGTAEYNLALGERRAREAKNYLVNLGVTQKRIKTISYGKERPLDPGHNEEAWAKNRRDHFVAN